MISRGIAAEVIVAPEAVFVLLVAENVQDRADDFEPFFVEDAFVTRALPVFVGQADWVAEGVDLVLALVQFLFHFRLVALPFAAGGSGIEGVGVRICENAIELAADHAADEMAQRLVLINVTKIRPDLGGAVPEPHGVDVAGNYEGVVVSLNASVADSGIKRVGETVCEHPVEFRIDRGKFVFKIDDLFLHGLASEAALLGSGAQVLCVVGSFFRSQKGRAKKQGQKKLFHQIFSMAASSQSPSKSSIMPLSQAAASLMFIGILPRIGSCHSLATSGSLLSPKIGNSLPQSGQTA